MARRKTKSQVRKPFWERNLERFVSLTKKMVVPALAIWLIGWLYLGGVFASTQAMIWDGFVDWTADRGMVVTDVMIDGRNRTPREKLQNAIAVNLNDPLLSLDLVAIQNRIEDLNWVDLVMVSRTYSGIVTIKLIEKIPFVIWDRPGTGRVVIDTKGNVIDGVSSDDYAQLLTVRGVDAPNHTVHLMQMILAQPSVADHIKGAEWIGDRRWDLITVQGARIHLPEGDMGHALSRLAKIQDDKNILKQNLKSIDLRADDRIILETPRGKSQDIMNLSSVDKTNSI